MSCKNGFTFIEMIVVLVIIAGTAVVAIPSFTPSIESARAKNVRNNLLAIYSAEQNYMNNNVNNNNTYCTSASLSPCSTLAQINTALSLDIQDDGTYLYQCPSATTCTASRTNSTANLVITATLNEPISLSAGANQNPACTSTTGNTNWCP